MTEARTQILATIRSALGRGHEGPTAPQRPTDARGANAIRPQAGVDIQAQFEAKARANLFVVHHISDLAEVPSAVADIARGSNTGTDISVAPSLAALSWPPAMTVRSAKARIGEKLAVNRALGAIAETGSLVLCSGDDAPASLTFAPEISVIVLSAGDIVPYLEDGLAEARRRQMPWPRTVNLVSGPSRTADVAGIVVRPAHGPKQVHVLIVGGASGSPA